LIEPKEYEAILDAIKEIGFPSNYSENDPSTGYYDKHALFEYDAFSYGVFEGICERVLKIAEEEFKTALIIDTAVLIGVIPGNLPEEHADSQNLDGTPKLGCNNFVVSAVVYLNDGFSGGDLVFPKAGYRYKPRAGSCVIFPSNLPYSHYVDSVLEGERLSLAIWFSQI
jgi:hypothetical protein